VTKVLARAEVGAISIRHISQSAMDYADFSLGTGQIHLWRF